MKKNYLYLMVGGMALITLSILLGYVFPNLGFETSLLEGIMFSTGIAFIFVAIFSHWFYGEDPIERDEMIKSIVDRSLSISWVITLFVIFGLGIINLFVSLSSEIVILILIFVIGWSGTLLMFYFKINPEKV
ncbi:MAG: hypothetical protein ACLFSM_08430 [Thermoplasmata archaeon]